MQPSVLLLDEPLTALDAALRERLRGELDRLLRTLGITTIYVTHDQAEAMALGDRIVVMRNGAIAQIGTPRDIYFEPTSRFVAEFVGAANILQATVEGGYAVLPGGRMRMPDGTAAGRATAMLRPESIAIIDARAPTSAGMSRAVSFIGDRQRLTISGAADRPIMVEAPNSLAVKAGQRVGLRSNRRRSGCCRTTVA